jgi:3-hydroxyisobutyrate dehydrogenase
MMRVAFLGLGIMGGGMAANLLVKGHELWVWNRTPARAEPLLARGARWAASPRAAAEVSGLEVLCTALADPAALEQVAFGDGGFVAGLGRGTRVVDFSTVSPALVQRLEAAVAERAGPEGGFLASPVTGSKNAAAAGTLLLMCGGDHKLLEALAPVLGAVSAKAVHVGTVAQAAQMKLAGNVIVAHMVGALSEAMALAARAGISAEKVLEVVQSSGYASPFWEFKGRALASRDFSTHFSVDLMHKDLTLALEAASAARLPLPGTAAIREVYQAARARGLGAHDITATATVLEPTG